jgi:hypothetical protein
MRRLAVVVVLALGLASCAAWNFVSGPPDVFVVFFFDRSTDLSPDGHQIVDKVAAAAHLSPEKIVQITGPSTKVMPGYDPGLAEPRIHAVELALQADGVSPDRMVRSSETTDAVKLATDPSGAQRVEIRLVDAPKH